MALRIVLAWIPNRRAASEMETRTESASVDVGDVAETEGGVIRLKIAKSVLFVNTSVDKTETTFPQLFLGHFSSQTLAQSTKMGYLMSYVVELSSISCREK